MNIILLDKIMVGIIFITGKFFGRAPETKCDPLHAYTHPAHTITDEGSKGNQEIQWPTYVAA